LLVTTDTDCTWKLDGVAQGKLSLDDPRVVKTTAGDHIIQAVSADGRLRWAGTVTADPSEQRIVKIPLSDSLPNWTDPATGLMWTKKNNGSDVTWQQASNYCQNLTLAGYSGWKLPTIDELDSIYDGTVLGLNVKGGILTGIMDWSSTVGNPSGEAWIVGFATIGDHRGHVPIDAVKFMRALCVRRSGE
jgi:hypothetical protein